MAEAHACHKLIYLSLREIFTGASAGFRKKKTVKKVLEEQRQKPQIRNLIQKGYDIDRISMIAQALLQEQIFESTTKAKARFPEVFQTSVHSPSTPQPSEHKAVAPTPKPPEPKVVALAPKLSENKVTVSGVAPIENAEPQLANNEINTDQANIKNTDTKSKSPTPQKASDFTTAPVSVYLPFWYQHRIMVQVQTTLESACFSFALRNLDDIVEENGWECAEAVELNKWPKILLEHKDKLDQRTLGDMEKPLPDLLTSIHQIRHTAVHRLRLPARSALDLMIDAEALAELLQDDASIETISTIHQHTSAAIEDLEETKHLLESRLVEIEEEYAQKRIQLALEEAALIESTREESKENDFFANANPDDTLDAIFAAQTSWKQRDRVSLSIDETYGPGKTHEPELETEMVYDLIVSVEGKSESSESCVALAESQPKLDEECGRLAEGPNADSQDNVAIPTTCETSGDCPERSKVAAVLDKPELCLRLYAADGQLNPSTGLHSPSTSECEYWATPRGSRSPTEEVPVMNSFKDSVATSE